MSKGQARWLAALACVLALTAACSTSGEPRSGSDTRTEQEVLNGANTLIVGSELIGFATAFFNTGTGRWELTDLLRGLRDTMDEVTEHAPNDRVVLLNDGTRFIPLNLSAKNTTREYRSVPEQGLVADYQGRTLTIALNTLRPFAPADVRGARGPVAPRGRRRRRGIGIELGEPQRDAERGRQLPRLGHDGVDRTGG